MSTFAASVADWVRDTEGALEAVWKESSQRIADETRKPVREGGRMRIVTGYLRASLMASTSAMPPIRQGGRPSGGSYAPDNQVSLVIAGADLGQTIYLGFTAEYAAFREYGSHGQPGDAFVRLAAQKWPEIVKDVEAELAARGGRN